MTEKKQSISAIREIFCGSFGDGAARPLSGIRRGFPCRRTKSDSKIPETGRGLEKRARAHGTDEDLRAQI